MKHRLPTEFTDEEIRIAIAGCGGNGSQFLNGLARMHIALTAVGHAGLDVAVFDPDIVTDANVGRQLFSPGDVGQSKARVLVNRVNNYFGLQWEAVHGALNNLDNASIAIPQIIVGCVDSIAARQMMSRLRYVDYWLDLGNTDKKGQVILGQLEHQWNDYHKRSRSENAMSAKRKAQLAAERAKEPQRLPHVLDIFPQLQRKNAKEDTAPSCSLAEALERQDLFINQTVATFALQLLWQFIRNGGLDIHGYFINLESGRVTPLPIK